MTHTPGPWKMCAHLVQRDACSCGYRGGIWSGDGEYIVCEMGSSPDIDPDGRVQGHIQPQGTRESQFADARLIAAAPDLLEAAQTICRLAKAHDVMDEEWDAAIDAAHTAIAKAVNVD